MDIYKKASKDGLRITTNKGLLSVEQLWSLPVEALDDIAVGLQTTVKKSAKKSFLETRTGTDAIAKLAFDIVLDILETKVKSSNTAAKAAETRAHNMKIDDLIAAKQDEALANLSVEELEGLRE